MRKLLLMSLVLTLTLLNQAVAQSKTVSGKVTDQTNAQGLPGVAVVVKGTSVGTTTSADGTYSINVPANSNTLVFRFIGYLPVEKTIGNTSTINVGMALDNKQLQEVVVTGYATKSKEEFTGAAASVTGEAIKDRPVQSFAQALTGQAAGVNIVQPNGVLNNPPVIRIRGINSISLSSFPLVVVDGIPIATGDASPNSAANNPLGDINPSDIESIDILKDAASTSIYGSRAAAGVLIITTKKGKQGKAKVSYDGWVGTGVAARLPELLNAEQYVEYKNEAVRNALSVNTALVPTAQRDANGVSFFPGEGNVDTKWYDEIYRRSVSQNHTFSVSGGNENTSYYFSAGISDQDGFIKTNSFTRRNTRLNINHKVTDWFNFRGNVTYSNSMNMAPQTGSLPGTSFASSGLARLALVLPPNVAPRNADGSYNITGSNTIGQGKNLAAITFQNPLPIMDLNTNTSENTRLISNIGADFNIFKGLTARTTYSYDRGNTENIQFWNPQHGDGWSWGGQAFNSTARRENWNWVNTLQYETTFGEKHNISLLAGTDVQKTTVDTWGSVRQTLTDVGFDLYQAGYTTNVAGGNGISYRAYESYLSSLNYNYGGKYFLSANFRRDGNSALATKQRWGNFGGASVGWALSEENFFKNSSLANTVSNVRLKGSWGRVGNGNLPSDFGSYSLFGTGLYGDISTLAYAQAGNEFLSWETSDQTNIGLDLAFLNNRITFETNYYKNDVNGLILEAPQAPSKGIPGNSILQNVGSMYNEGLEFSLGATPIDRGKFSWKTNFNLTLNKNEVTALAGGNAPIPGVTQLETANLTSVGNSVGSLWVVRTNGVNPQNGRRIFINKKGEEVQYLHGGGANAWTYLDGKVASAVTAADASAMYNTLPTWYGGFNNNFTYGNFDLSIMFTYSGGNYIYNGTQAGLRDQRFWNNHTDVLSRWQKEGDQTEIPRPIFGDNVSNGSSFPIDVNVEKGDFLRLQNTVLGYRLPAQLFGKTGISSLRVYGQIDNAFLLTKYSGVDPEISTNGNSNLAPGVERNTVPQGRMFTMGVNLGF
ncbi:SusC/RagA family TonB-linked outer membrane protein [Pontibacter cellulosilyticus]|uniref:TonB-dependent receptor n=1 Tax=Pontibacter cellulosilyticus TaxID=1720253 RepID=A0A923SIU2_9BACT|nr:TonB-dependent receptor [Pontibacter cellulosilyticus]MBC5993189.1 TonB-dependent receptor [Pontibacter cellulosilyticus]